MADGHVQTREPPEALRRARRSIDGLAGVVDLGDWTWAERQGEWALRVVLEHGTPATEHVPRTTTWYALASACYPWGDLRLFPASRGGIIATFPHQLDNYEVEGRAWTHGEICVAEHQHVLGRWGGCQERYEAESRLAWRVGRALGWLRDAARGTLAVAGEPFELPDFGAKATPRLAFRTSIDDPLLSSVGSHGLAHLVHLTEDVPVLSTLTDPSRGKTLEFPWWKVLGKLDRPSLTAAWLRVDSVPVVAPWQAPRTFGELRACLLRSGVDVDRILGRFSRKLAKEKVPMLLVGFPIPKQVGGRPEAWHWQPVRLTQLPPASRPKWSRRASTAAGAITDDARVEWLAADSWDDDALLVRGKLAPELRTAKVLLVGAGALGSVLAEMLVRAGARDVFLIDREVLAPGNIARHTLRLGDVGVHKAPALAARLQLLAPDARIASKVGSFPRDVPDEVRESATLILDTTGDDVAIFEAGAAAWCQGKRLASISFDYGARRMTCFAGTCTPAVHDEFQSRRRPWLEALAEETVIDAGMRQGPGCWHPTWPGRCDHVWGLAAAAVPFVEQHLDAGAANTLVVYERGDGGTICILDDESGR